jgi:hypothetical protein
VCTHIPNSVIINRTATSGTLHESLLAFLPASRSQLGKYLSSEHFFNKVVDKNKTRNLCPIHSFVNHKLFEIIQHKVFETTMLKITAAETSRLILPVLSTTSSTLGLLSDMVSSFQSPRTPNGQHLRVSHVFHPIILTITRTAVQFTPRLFSSTVTFSMIF